MPEPTLETVSTVLEFDTPEQQSSVDSQTNVPDESTEETKAPQPYTLNEVEYTPEQLDDHLNAYQNKDKWTKSNTESAQENANTRKLMEPIMAHLVPHLENQEFLDGIDNLYKGITQGDEGISQHFTKELSDIQSPFQSELDEANSRADSAEQALATFKSEIALTQETSELKGKYEGITDRKLEVLAGEVLQRHKDTGSFISIEEAAKLNHPEWLAVKRKAIRSTSSTRATTTASSSTIPKSYQDIPDKVHKLEFT